MNQVETQNYIGYHIEGDNFTVLRTGDKRKTDPGCIIYEPGGDIDLDAEYDEEFIQAVKKYFTDTEAQMRKNIAAFLFALYIALGIDKPSNHDTIVDYCFADIVETADYNYNNDDIRIAFRRFIERD